MNWFVEGLKKDGEKQSAWFNGLAHRICFLSLCMTIIAWFMALIRGDAVKWLKSMTEYSGSVILIATFMSSLYLMSMFFQYREKKKK